MARVTTVAQVQSLAWELSHAIGTVKKERANKLIPLMEKEIRIMVTRGSGWEEGDLDEGSSKGTNFQL